jgi:hypothetical protein
MKYDKPLLAIFYSILGAVPVGIYVEIMKFYHFTNISALQALSMMFIREGSTSLGILSHIGYSAVLGLILYYSAKILGTDYFPIKAVFISMVSESLLFIIFGTFMRNENMIQTVAGNYTMASAAALGGLCRGYLIKEYLFTKHKY